MPDRAVALLVGREHELERGVQAVDLSLAGRGRLVLLSGEAGIGKTRLAEEIAAVAAQRGARVTWARAADPDTSPSYGLWRLVLTGLGDNRQQGENLWSLTFGAPSPGAPGSDSDIARDQRFALFDAVRGYLDQAARPSGLVVVLDDVQWADEPSMLLLAHLVRQLAAMPVAVIATWRVPGESASPVLQALAADSATERLDLGGLSIGALEELLAASGYPSLVRQAEGLLADTGGNPFYIRELVRAQAEQPAARGQLTVPASVRDVTGQRLARLDPASQLALSAAAVAGGEFSVGVVALMLGVPALTLLGTVDRCIAAGFLTPAERPGEFRFAHALVRAAVVDRLTSAERRRWHDAAADAIAAFHQDRVGPHLAELASHLVHSSMPGDRIRAVLACEAAADVAAEDLAFEEAARLYREALATGHDELPEQDRSRLELALAVAAYRIGDLTSWHDAVMAVGHRAELRKDRDLLARAALAMEPTGGARWDGEISRLCEQALVGEQLTGALRVRVEARYAQALAYRGDEERAGEVSLRALRAAERTADPAVLIGALQARQLACSGPDGHSERAGLARRMRAVAGEAGSAWPELWARTWQIDTLLEAGELAAVSQALRDLAVCAERARGPLARWHLLQYSATLAHATGQYGEAVRLAGEAFGALSSMGHPAGFGSYAALLCQIGRHIGFGESGAEGLFGRLRADPANARADDANDSLKSVFPALAVALISLQRGQADEAARCYERAGPARSWDPAPSLRLSAWALGLDVAIALGAMSDVSYLAGRLAPYGGIHIASGAGGGGYLGPVMLHLGKAATALSHHDQAVAHLEAARTACAQAGAPGFAVEASAELAWALASRGSHSDRDAALSVLTMAAPVAARLEMTPFSERIVRLRERLRAPGPAGQELSPREAEVAKLVGQGLTNRQIAAALFISERTAQNHVQHILVKLGLGNRSQIAVWATARPAGE
jgi:DNA-binding CsgD family transcriptional regulator/tetratricopeptide (TPR) repeat protein